MFLKLKQIRLPDVTLPNENSGMVNRLCHTRLENKCLQTALKEVLNSQCQDIIKLVLTLIQKPVAVHPTEKSLTLKDTAGVLLIEGQKHPSIVTDTAQCILNSPQLPLAMKSILTNEFQLSIQTLLLIGTTGLLECLPI